MQNLVFLMEPNDDACDISWKGAHMMLNRFCIDEDAAVELSGVYSLKPSSADISFRKSLWFALERKVKGME